MMYFICRNMEENRHKKTRAGRPGLNNICKLKPQRRLKLVAFQKSANRLHILKRKINELPPPIPSGNSGFRGFPFGLTQATLALQLTMLC